MGGRWRGEVLRGGLDVVWRGLSCGLRGRRWVARGLRRVWEVLGRLVFVARRGSAVYRGLLPLLARVHAHCDCCWSCETEGIGLRGDWGDVSMGADGGGVPGTYAAAASSARSSEPT